MLERLGIDQTNDQENSAGQQLLAQPLPLPPCATAAALPLEGNVRPDALVPGVVQPRLIAGATYAAPHAEAGRHLAKPLHIELLRDRGGQ